MPVTRFARCDGVLSALDQNAMLERVAVEIWQGRAVRLYRIK